MDREELAGLSNHLRQLLATVNPAVVSAFDDQAMLALTESFLDEAATQHWLSEQLYKMRVKSMDLANGAAVELIPAQETAAMWAGICRGLLQEAPNYSETKFDQLDLEGKITMEIQPPGSREAFTVTVQRHGPGKLTPHEARLRAEAAVHAAWKWIGDVNDGLGYDTGDLGARLTKHGFPPPAEEDGGDE